MNASSQIVADYRDMLPAWVTEARVRALLESAPERFAMELQTAMAREDVMGRTHDVPRLLVEWLAAAEIHSRRDEVARDWDGLAEVPIDEYAAKA